MKVSTGTVMNVKRGMTSLENLKVVPVNQTKELAKISTREKIAYYNNELDKRKKR